VTLMKAKLTVVLRADDVVVAEVEDATLWQRVRGFMLMQERASKRRRKS